MPAPDDKKKSVRELLKNQGLMNFLLNYIKDMKNETLQILLSQETASLLESFKVQPNELHKLSDEQLIQVKNSMLENSGHSIYNTLRDYQAIYRFNYQ